MFIYNPLWHRSLQSPDRTGPQRGADGRRLLAGLAGSQDQLPPPPPRRKCAGPAAAGTRPPCPPGGPALGLPLPQGRAGPAPPPLPLFAPPPAQRPRPRRACLRRAPPAAAAAIRGKSRTGSRAGAWSGGCRSSAGPQHPGAVRRAGRHQRRDRDGHGPAGDTPLPWQSAAAVPVRLRACATGLFTRDFSFMEESRVGEAGRCQPRFHRENGTA